jgi:hypothetical protein
MATMLRSFVAAVFAVSTLGVPSQRLSRGIDGSTAAQDKPIAIAQLAIDALADSSGLISELLSTRGLLISSRGSWWPSVTMRIPWSHRVQLAIL